MQKTAIIIGAGPAGLTAAYELLDKTDIKPIIVEMSPVVGGLAKSVDFKGNKIDIGPHRYFSKSDKIMQWWENILPLQGRPASDDLALQREIPLRNEARVKPIKQKAYISIPAPDPEKTDKLMLYRNRLTRIFFLKKFFDYPISFSFKTFINLGILRAMRIAFSFFKIRLRPLKEEKSLEDFFINRFGHELYDTFFKDYTEKVWGIPANKVSASWGSQRVKGVSISEAFKHWLKKSFSKSTGLDQKDTETSLIDKFKFPKLGSGQIWSEVAEIITREGGEIYFGLQAIELLEEKNKILGLVATTETAGDVKTFYGDYFFSTMPVKELVQALKKNLPEEIRKIGEGLMYRDVIIVGLILKKLDLKNTTHIKTLNGLIPDNWLYIQERDVKIGRMSIKNNFSPYIIADKNTVVLSLEYFSNKGDEMWERSSSEMIDFALNELEKMQILKKEYFIDGTVIKELNAYPIYLGTYDYFDNLIEYFNRIENLFLIGRNGMHRYNNMDHSMMTAIQAVDNIINGSMDKSSIWKINIEKEYHEEK